MQKAFLWLLRKGELPGVYYDFLSKDLTANSPLLTVEYVPRFDEWSDGSAVVGRAPFDGPIQIFRGGANSLVGAFDTYAHVVLHRHPTYKQAFLSAHDTAAVNALHGQMAPHITSAVTAFRGLQTRMAMEGVW